MFYFKDVSLVIRRVWVVKTLASQRSLSRKLHKEASWESFSRKLPEAVSIEAPSFINLLIFSEFGLEVHRIDVHDLTVAIWDMSSGVWETLFFLRTETLECFKSYFSCSLGKKSFLSPSFFQNPFLMSQASSSPPTTTMNHRSSPMKPHTERNPLIRAESSKLVSRFR